MTVIVERLRKRADLNSLRSVDGKIEAEAADEIERLRLVRAVVESTIVDKAVAAERAATIELLEHAYHNGTCRGHFALRELIAAIKARSEE
jgi:hypothetical protein